jgi:delta-aminolevulinic acid dehydratase/porphobilinogen synthase
MEDTDPGNKGGNVEISSMPNCYRHTLPSMMKEIDEAVRSIILVFDIPHEFLQLWCWGYCVVSND